MTDVVVRRRGPRKPTENMIKIAAVLASGPQTWWAIQAGFPMHGAVLSGILNAMIRRGMVIETEDIYRLVPEGEWVPLYD
jgi:hypothetical protein